MSARHDLVIRNGTVIDGTRAPRYAADVAIDAGRIAGIGSIAPASGREEIDAAGMIVAPGFIDAHTHDDRLMLSDPDMAPKVSQGVTTVVAGNCGVSLAPLCVEGRPPTPPLDLLDGNGAWFRFGSFGEYAAALRDAPPAVNAALLVGHSTLRCAAMDDVARAARPAEIAAMQAMAREALGAGAIGVSTGLHYEVAAAATTEEVIEVCAPLKDAGGLYCTHMRDEADGVIDALEETFRIGRALDVPVVISHHKLLGVPNHGRSRETLALIASRMQSQPVCLDCYPYAASSTILTASRVRIASRTLVTWSKAMPQHAGRDLADIARELGTTPQQAVARLAPAGAIYFSMDEDDVQRILAFAPTMIGSDGLPHDASPHPRLWGTFPRVLGRYSRELGLFPLETAVHKMTGLTAKNFGLRDRGEIRVGAHADLVVFDAGRVGEAASFERPVQPAQGISTVIVNGAAVWRDGGPTGARPGRVLARG